MDKSKFNVKNEFKILNRRFNFLIFLLLLILGISLLNFSLLMYLIYKSIYYLFLSFVCGIFTVMLAGFWLIWIINLLKVEKQ